MAMSKSPAFTMADRRKKVTYGKFASLAAPRNFKEDAPSPERLRKQADGSHGSLERYGNKFGASNTLSSVRATRQTPRNILDVPSDDDEPTPRPSAAPTKKGPPKDDEFDVFDVPSSGDKRPNTGCRRAKTAQPARKVDAAPPPVSTQKKRLRERGRVAEPSANDASVAPQAPQALPARQRAKTPQAVQMPPVESIGRRAVLSTAMATLPEYDPKQASHTRPAKRRKLEHDPKQASHTKPAKKWSVDELIEWIQQEQNIPLNEDEREKLRTARVSGIAFLSCDGDKSFFRDDCGLSPGTALVLAKLSIKLAKEERIRKQTEDVRMSGAAPPHSLVSSSGISRKIQDVASRWNKFYNHARAFHDNREEDIDTEVSYRFPEDNDGALDKACEALSNALQDASKAMVVNDNAEVKQAVDNLRKTYGDAAKSKTVMRYIDAEPPSAPYSPLNKSIERTILARPWMKELISGLRDQSLPARLVVIGSPGIGKSVSLVGYLLFYLITLGQRVILQSATTHGGLGYVFDDNGVHEVFSDDAWNYDDDRPCYLLVSADGTEIYPSDAFAFCDRIIVVTSPNLVSKRGLKNWMTQTQARQFIAPLPSCHEVVYLLSRIRKFDSFIVYWIYREWTRDFRRCEIDCEDAIFHLNEGTLSNWYRMKQQRIKDLVRGMILSGQGSNEVHQIHDTRTNMTIPSVLVTMERNGGRTDEYYLMFATPRIAWVVADVQETLSWTSNLETLTLFLRNPETRVAAGRKFQNMFLRKFRTQDPNTMPRCYTLRQKEGPHPQSDSASPAKMPWYDLRQQPTSKWISVGKDTDGSLYSKKELEAAMKAVTLKPGDPPAIRFLIPCAENWASWDAALFLGKHRKNGVDIHIVFLQLTVDPDHEILAKGLNQVRDAVILSKLKGVWIHYHYVLVLLTDSDGVDGLSIPPWRPVLNNSKDRKIDGSWDINNLKQFIMFVPRTELAKTPLED